MTLILVRHGDAVSDQIDPNRPLSRVGQNEVIKVAQFLKESAVNVTNIFHSSKLRAKQTAELMSKDINPQATLAEKPYLSPNSSPDDLLYEIQSWQNNSMVVSHLPLIPILLLRLLNIDEARNYFSISTSCAIILENDGNNNWYVVGLINPRLIP